MDLFTIEPLSLYMFLSDQKLRLPRYQRKDTWKSNQNFDLCISVFQGYPIGVCIVNRFKEVTWLLDGRQRRNALDELYNNPVAVYDWAKAYCKISPSDNEFEVREKFRLKINAYLDADKSDDSEIQDGEFEPNGNTEIHSNEEEGIQDDSEVASENEVSEVLGNVSKIIKPMDGLLNLILMVHQKKNTTNDWYKAFDFSKYFKQKALQYYPLINGKDSLFLANYVFL